MGFPYEALLVRAQGLRCLAQAHAVMSCEELGGCKPRIPGMHKDTGPSYPQGVVVSAPPGMAGLYVVATNNKEDVVVAKVPFESL